MALKPRKAEAHYLRGTVYLHMKEWQKAEADLSVAVRYDPFHAESYMARSMVFTQLNDYPRALGDLNSRVRLNPPDPEAWHLRGLLRAEKKSYDQALADFNEVLRLKPEHARALNARAMCYAERKDFDKALADLKRSLELEPTMHETWYDRGKLYQDRGSFRAAITDYEKAIELGPDVPRYRNQLAWLLATCPLDAFRNGPRAVEHATRACELEEWKDGNTIDTLAAALAECGHFAEAAARGRQAVECAPKEVLEQVREHLKLFEANRPVRTDPPPPTAPKPGHKGKDGKKKRRR